MCGIGGMFGDGRGLDGAALLRALAHRGPDRTAAAQPDAQVWLGATRLAIVDPTAAGDQPMTDGALTVVHNGEIYNAPSLRASLEALGHRFRSRCDTEVLLHGYRAWGDALVERLEGMFAFALWDGDGRRLLLARDALGIKPLWIARSPSVAGRVVAFASEVRALLAAGAAERRLEPAAVARYLARGSVGEPGAIVRGVEALAPGTLAVLTMEGGRVATRARRWFSLPVEERAGSRAPSDAAALVRARLDEAVSGCLVSDVPMALLLSGGIDSAAIALVARRLGARLSAFHVRTAKAGAPVGGGAASSRAAALARRLELPYREVTVDGGDVRDAAQAALAAQDQPSLDGTNSWIIARAIAAAGLRVALSGLGADELFLGYPLHRRFVALRALRGGLARGGLSPALEGVARLAGVALRGARQARSVGASLPLGAGKLLDLAAASDGETTYAALRALFPSASRAALLDRAQAPGHVAGAELAPDLSTAGEVSRREIAGYLVDTLLRDADAMSMAHSVELRVPLLARGLVEAVVPLAPAFDLVGAPKRLLVDAVPELPPGIAAGAKEGFELPFEAWLADDGPRGLGRAVAEALHDGASCRRAGLAPAAVARVLATARARGDRPSAHRAWALHALVAWATAHGASV